MSPYDRNNLTELDILRAQNIALRKICFRKYSTRGAPHPENFLRKHTKTSETGARLVQCSVSMNAERFFLAVTRLTRIVQHHELYIRQLQMHKTQGRITLS